MPKPGRPEGTTKHGELKDKKLTLRLSEKAYLWVKSQPKGWLSDWLEEQAVSSFNNPPAYLKKFREERSNETER